jgi:hypothetical protein
VGGRENFKFSDGKAELCDALLNGPGVVLLLGDFVKECKSVIQREPVFQMMEVFITERKKQVFADELEAMFLTSYRVRMRNWARFCQASCLV